jgi:chorismate mutase
MGCRGIRGATTVEIDTADAIVAATRELLVRLVASDIASAIFTVTPDLTATFPARAARDLGWQHVPLLDAQEVPVPDSLSRCVRVLVLWNTERSQDEIQHVYLRDAGSLRPDLYKSEQI